MQTPTLANQNGPNITSEKGVNKTFETLSYVERIERAGNLFNAITRLYESIDEEDYEDLVLVLAASEPDTKKWQEEFHELSDLADPREAKDVAYNIFLVNKGGRNDIYFSILPHSRAAIEAKKKKARDSKTAYPRAKLLAIDIDVENIPHVINHGKRTIYNTQQLVQILQTLATKLLEKIPTPTAMYYTGGGLLILYILDGFADADELMNWAKRELRPRLQHVIDTILEEQGILNPGEYQKPPVAVDSAVFDKGRVVRIPYSINWKYKTEDGNPRPLQGAVIIEDLKHMVNLEQLKEHFNAIELPAQKEQYYSQQVHLEEAEREVWELTEDWEREAGVPPEELTDADKSELANEIYSIIAPHWLEGQRHILALALAGVLRKTIRNEGVAQDIFARVISRLIAEGKEDSNELNDRLLTFKTTFEQEPDKVATVSLLIEKAGMDEASARTLISDLRQAINTRLRYRILDFTRPEVMTKVEKDAEYYYFYFADIPHPWVVKYEELITFKGAGDKITTQLQVPKKAILSLRAHLKKYGYQPRFPVTRDENGEYIINQRYLARIFENATTRAKAANLSKEVEKHIEAELALEAIKLADNIVHARTPNGAREVAYLTDGDGKIIHLAIPTPLLFEAGVKMKLVDAKSALRTGILELMMILKDADKQHSRRLFLQKKQKSFRQGGKVVFGFRYYVIDPQELELRTGKDLSAFIDELMKKKNGEIDDELAVILQEYKKTQEGGDEE